MKLLKLFKRYLLMIEVVLLFFIALCGCNSGDLESVLELESAVGSESESIAEGKDSTEQSSTSHNTEREAEYIYVYVCGAVEQPGVVKLIQGSRGELAVLEAGGMTADADSTYVNLATKLEDGEKLFIPTKEEAILLEQEQQTKESGIININTAELEGLCTLPGIGESRARDIIMYREKNGRFEHIEDIMKVSGIKTNAFEKIKDKIAVE